MTLHSMHFMGHQQVADFINSTPILQANILKIDSDSSSGGWVLWWYA